MKNIYGESKHEKKSILLLKKGRHWSLTKSRVQSSKQTTRWSDHGATLVKVYI